MWRRRPRPSSLRHPLPCRPLRARRLVASGPQSALAAHVRFVGPAGRRRDRRRPTRRRPPRRKGSRRRSPPRRFAIRCRDHDPHGAGVEPSSCRRGVGPKTARPPRPRSSRSRPAPSRRAAHRGRSRASGPRARGLPKRRPADRSRRRSVVGRSNVRRRFAPVRLAAGAASRCCPCRRFPIRRPGPIRRPRLPDHLEVRPVGWTRRRPAPFRPSSVLPSVATRRDDGAGRGQRASGSGRLGAGRGPDARERGEHVLPWLSRRLVAHAGNPVLGGRPGRGSRTAVRSSRGGASPPRTSPGVIAAPWPRARRANLVPG